jgi:hypothetical protein
VKEEAMASKNDEVERRNKLEEEEQEFDYELVEVLPLLALVASVLLIAAFISLAHA